MRVDDELTRVPVVFDGVDLADEETAVSLVDLAPTLMGAAGVDPAPEFHGMDLTERVRDHTITIAPWADEATVAWRYDGQKLVARESDIRLTEDGSSATVGETDVSEEMRQQLRDLGYIDAG